MEPTIPETQPKVTRSLLATPELAAAAPEVCEEPAVVVEPVCPVLPLPVALALSPPVVVVAPPLLPVLSAAAVPDRRAAPLVGSETSPETSHNPLVKGGHSGGLLLGL